MRHAVGRTFGVDASFDERSRKRGRARPLNSDVGHPQRRELRRCRHSLSGRLRPHHMDGVPGASRSVFLGWAVSQVQVVHPDLRPRLEQEESLAVLY